MKTPILFRTSVLVLLLIVLGKVFAFGKDVVISGFFGAGLDADSFFVALNITSILFVALYSTVSMVFLPFYNEQKIKHGLQAANLFSSNVINIYLVAVLVLMVVTYYFSPEIVNITNSSPRPESISLTVSLTRIMILSFIFSIFISFMTSMQISNEKYLSPHLAPIINNLIVALAIIVFSPKYGIYVPAVAGVIAWMLQAPLHKWILKDHFHYIFHMNLKDESLRKMGLLFFPAFLGVFVDQANILVDTILASGLSEGSVSALNYSNRLVSFSSGMFVMAILTIMYPIFSKLIISGEKYNLIKAIQNSIRSLILVMLPITGIVFVYNYEIVSIVFQRGRFDEVATQATSTAFFFYGIGLAFLALRELFNKVFYAKKNTKAPLCISFIAVSVNIVLSVLLVGVMGVAGLALASSISLILYVGVQVALLYKILGSELYHGLFSFLGRVAFATSMATYVMCLCKEYNYFDSPFMVFFTGTSLGIVSYVILLFILKIEEIIFLNIYIKSVFRRGISRT